jgi:hypothetical protein
MVTKVNSTVIDGTNSNVSLANNSNLLGGVSAGQIQSQSFYSTDTWTCPTGVTRARVTVIGGGGGGSTNSIGARAGGGQGGLAYAVVTVTPETQYTVTIGLGGAFASGSGTRTGGTGQTSSFGALVTATGGTGGVSSSSGGAGGSNGTGSTSGTLIRSAFAGVFSLIGGGSLVASLAPVVASATNGVAPGSGGNDIGDGDWVGASSGAVLVEWVGA